MTVLKCEVVAHIYILHPQKISGEKFCDCKQCDKAFVFFIHWIQYKSNTTGLLSPHNILGSWTVTPTHLFEPDTELLFLKIINICASLQLIFFNHDLGICGLLTSLRKSPEAKCRFLQSYQSKSFVLLWLGKGILF